MRSRLLSDPSPATRSYCETQLLHFDREDVVVQFGLKHAKAAREVLDHIGIKGEPMPVQPFAEDTCPSTDEIKVSPAAPENLGASKASTFHKQDRGQLIRRAAARTRCNSSRLGR